MNAAAWAVFGVFIGAALPAVSALWSEHRADKRAEAERRERAATRLFEIRREKFEEFQKSARWHLDYLWDYYSGVGSLREPDYDFTDGLVTALAPVHLYGSDATAEAAGAFLRALVEYLNSDPADAPTVEMENAVYNHADAALKDFAKAARADLSGT